MYKILKMKKMNLKTRLKRETPQTWQRQARTLKTKAKKSKERKIYYEQPDQSANCNPAA